MKSKKVKDENMDINPYEMDKLAKVPSWLKILLLKYWAAAAASFLLFGISFLGLDIFKESEVDNIETTVKLVILIGLFLAVFMNYGVRLVVRLMYNRRNNTYRYNMVNIKGLKSFFVSIFYNMLMALIIYYVTVYILSPNGLVFDPFGTTGGIGIEPFTVGLIYLFFDAIFLVIKNLILMAFQRYKYKKQVTSNIKIQVAGE